MTAALVFPGATAALVRDALPPGAFVIAVDAGAEALREAGRAPDVVVGDMDSVSGETLAHFQRMGVRVERHPPDKRDTDGALALRHAKGHARVVFLGAGGGRADHAIANLHLLLAASREADARAIDTDASYYVATPDRPLDLDLPVGTLVSILPLEGPCEGIAYEGLRYPLKDAVMLPGDPYGVSNACAAPTQRIALTRGALLVVRPRAPTA